MLNFINVIKKIRCQVIEGIGCKVILHFMETVVMIPSDIYKKAKIGVHIIQKPLKVRNTTRTNLEKAIIRVK